MAASANHPFAFLLALSLSLVSCASECIEPDCAVSPAPGQGLAATWRWVQSSGGLAGSTETAASTKKVMDLQLNADSTYSIRTNGIVSAAGTYSLTMRQCIHDHTSKRVIVFSAGGGRQMMIEQLNSTSLGLSDELYDGFVSLYYRQ